MTDFQAGDVTGAAPGRALVAYRAAQSRDDVPPLSGFGSGRTNAAFLAQLLAARAHAPSQRAKKRAAPEVGAAAYRESLCLLAGSSAGRVRIET
jgi:hypothetical protein